MINYIWQIIQCISKNQTIFEYFDWSYTIFKKSHNALLFWLIIYDFFSKYNRAAVFNQSEIWNDHAANIQNKMYIKFQIIYK